MEEQDLQNAEEQQPKDVDALSLEQLSGDLKLGDLLAYHLEDLKSQNPDAHAIITEKVKIGFFEETLGKKALNNLVDQILKTIDNLEEENENIVD